MNEGPDLAYNQSVPADWWLTSWRPSQWCYGLSTYGGGWGAGTDDDACTTNNAYCMCVYLRAQGWGLQSIAAVCGNAMNESGFDPRNWEYDGDINAGFGLVQWTPQRQYQADAEGIWGVNDGFAPYYYSGWEECFFMASQVWDYPRRKWVPHRKGPGYNPAPGSGGVYPGSAPDHDYTLSYEEFALGRISDSDISTDAYDRIEYLTGAFYWDFEQVADYIVDNTLYQRRSRAEAFYLRLRNIFPDFKGFVLKNPCDPVDGDTTLADALLFTNPNMGFLAAITRQQQQRRGKQIIKIV